jgi:hypothetical protein
MNINKYLDLLESNNCGDNYIHGLINELKYECIDRLLYRNLTPKLDDKNNYVGVEIECIVSCDIDKVTDLLIQNNLVNKVIITEDGSIDIDDYSDGEGIELRILDTEQNIKYTVNKVIKLLKSIKATVNESCGLHVHLDARNRDKNKLFNNFMICQDYLYSLVADYRKDNTYSYWRPLDHYNKNDNEHYYGVSRSDKGTVEIRMHHGTLNTNKINRWIDLLVLIANRKTQLKRKIDIIPKNEVIKKLKLVA